MDVFFPALNIKAHNAEAAGSVTVGAADADIKVGWQGQDVYNYRVPQATQKAVKVTLIMAS